ncbi:MAG: glucose-6-phosphate isomerase family protein [Candidatus Diapherotrites archaeon]
MPSVFVDLQKISGLPLKLDKKTNRAVFGSGARKVDAVIRTGAEMRQALADADSVEPAKECYYMYRGVCMEHDALEIESAGLRYDITVLPALMLGKEFNKTFGHFHPKVPGTAMSYTEVYEVLQGKAHYILQNPACTEFFVFEASAGEKVVIPPGYGHVTINPSKTETLVMSDWTAAGFKSDYGVFRERHGAAQYETAKGWIKNKKYAKVPKMRMVKPREVPEFGFRKGKPMYSLVQEGKLELLDFLKMPADYAKVFERLLR